MVNVGVGSVLDFSHFFEKVKLMPLLWLIQGAALLNNV